MCWHCTTGTKYVLSGGTADARCSLVSCTATMDCLSVFVLQPKGQVPSRPDLMALAAQRIQQPLTQGLLGRGPPLTGPSFAPSHYGALPGLGPHPSPGPDPYPPYPSTSYGFPLQRSFEGYGQSLTSGYLSQPSGSPLAHQHLPFVLTTAGLGDISGMTTMDSLPQQQSQYVYGQQSDTAHASQLRPNFPPNQLLPPNAYQQKVISAQDFTMSAETGFAYSQPYASMPAGGSFYS